MRLFGIVLVLLGALALGVQGFSYLGRTRDEPAPTRTQAGANDQAVWVSPVLGGIAVVSGLLMLATDGRRD